MYAQSHIYILYINFLLDRFLTAPGLAWQAALKKTEVKFKLISFN